VSSDQLITADVILRRTNIALGPARISCRKPVTEVHKLIRPRQSVYVFQR